MQGHILNEFVHDVVVRYVEDDKAEIRRKAALTCCQLFVKDPIVHQTSHHATAVVSDVIGKLLTVGVADLEPEIRQTILSSLDARFDRHLATQERIRTLFFALNDELYSIREAAIAIITRLASVNPAYVFAPLRKFLLQLMTRVQYSDSHRGKEEGAKLISQLINSANASTWIKHFVKPIITVLLPKAKEPHGDVAATTLKAIGDLATVGVKN